ncbi:hypothetical protein L7F22_045468 [Adiantum nelumboides]|nr:hypothetical protein [Adiantum nelumboides]
MCLGYSACAVGGSIYAGHDHPTNKDYSLHGGKVSKMFGVFNSFAIIATTYGNGIIPEIQATLAPPVAGKMFKGLCVCYTVVASTFFSVAVSGYWAFGNKSFGNLLSNLAPLNEPALVPNWLIILANMLVLLQLLAVAMIVHVEGKKNVVADALSRKPQVSAVSISYQNELEEMKGQYVEDEDFARIYDPIVNG